MAARGAYVNVYTDRTKPRPHEKRNATPGLDEHDPETIRVAEEFLAEDPNAIILAVLPVGHVFDHPLPITLAKKVRVLWFVWMHQFVCSYSPQAWFLSTAFPQTPPLPKIVRPGLEAHHRRGDQDGPRGEGHGAGREAPDDQPAGPQPAARVRTYVYVHVHGWRSRCWGFGAMGCVGWLTAWGTDIFHTHPTPTPARPR